MGAISLALYVVLFHGVPNFSSDDAEHILTELSGHLAKETDDRGMESRLQYSGIEIEGLGYDKWARIRNLSWDLTVPRWHERTRFGVSTAVADLVPDQAVSAYRMWLRFPDALNLLMGSDLLAILEPSQPWLYTVTRHPPEMKDAIRHRLVIPGSVGISSLMPKQRWELTQDRSIRMDVHVFDQQHGVRADLVSGPLRVLGDDRKWVLAGAEFHHQSAHRAAYVVESKNTLTLDQVAFSHANHEALPYTLTAAWSVKEQRNISGAVDSRILELEHVLMSREEMKLSLTGKINSDIDDAPYGDMVLEISHPEVLLRQGWIAPGKEALVLKLLEEIMGEPVGSHHQLIINITRMKNGAWKVGKMPLTQLLDEGLWSIFGFLDEAKEQS